VAIAFADASELGFVPLTVFRQSVVVAMIVVVVDSPAIHPQMCICMCVIAFDCRPCICICSCICIFDCIMTKTICKYAFNWFVIIIAVAVVLLLSFSSGLRCVNRLGCWFNNLRINCT